MKLSHYSKLALMAIAVWSVSFTSLSFADAMSAKGACTKPGCHKAFEQKRAEFAKKLGLTADQQAQLKAQHEQFKTANQTTFNTMKGQREQLKAFAKAGKKDSPEAQNLKAQLKQEREGLRQQHEAIMQSVLTPTQMAQFKQMKEEWRAKHPKGKFGKKSAPSQG